MPIPSWKSGLQEIASNVFAHIHSGVGWDICNSGFIVGDDGVLVIDAMMVASQVRSYLEEIRTVTDKPIRYVVNTHHHVDHSFGNQFYLPTEVVSHRWCREAMINSGADVEVLSQRYPHLSCLRNITRCVRHCPCNSSTSEWECDWFIINYGFNSYTVSGNKFFKFNIVHSRISCFRCNILWRNNYW